MNAARWQKFHGINFHCSSTSHEWTAAIKMNNQEIVFKLYTGAEATTITTKTFKTLKNIKLQQSAKVLCGPNNHLLNILGQAVVQLTSEGRSFKQPIYVIEDLKNDLLGLPAITALYNFSPKLTVCSQGMFNRVFLNCFKAWAHSKEIITFSWIKMLSISLMLSTLQEMFLYLSEEKSNRS